MKFVFHAGAGKTGTSSIQRTLKQQAAELRQHGVWYLGLTLEYADHRPFGWQRPSGEAVLSKLDPEVARRQVCEVLEATIEAAHKEGVETLIWSNEAFFDRYAYLLPALRALVREDVDLLALAYVRRHADWMQSAYIQWGLNHKTFPGRIRKFRDFSDERKPCFAQTLRDYHDALGKHFIVRNYDAAGDIVDDFCVTVGIDDISLSHIRANQTPDNAEILMRTLFNDSLPETALPALWERVVGVHVDLNHNSPTDYLSALYPTESDLVHISNSTAEDRSAVNAMLQEQGQRGLEAGVGKMLSPYVDPERLLLSITKLCMMQARRIQNLEHRLTQLEQSATQGT